MPQVFIVIVQNGKTPSVNVGWFSFQLDAAQLRGTALNKGGREKGENRGSRVEDNTYLFCNTLTVVLFLYHKNRKLLLSHSPLITFNQKKKKT